MIKKVLNANVDTIIYICLHVSKDEVLNVHIINEGIHRDKIRGGDIGIWCHSLLLVHL